MSRPAKIRLDNSPHGGRMAPMETTGAITPSDDTSVASLTNGADKRVATPEEAAKGATPLKTKPQHQTHGAVIPTGTIKSVGDLLGGRSMARGSVGSYDTIESYRSYLNSLTLGELHRHAVEEARTVPIDDRNRLIRRLESEWTATASRSMGRKVTPIPQPTQYTAEQLATNEALYKKMLRK